MLPANHLHLLVRYMQNIQVPGVTPTSGLSGGAYTLTLAQLGWNGTDILTFWRAIVNEGKTRLGSGVLGRLNALSVVSSMAYASDL
jgi:hypothetical protein